MMKHASQSRNVYEDFVVETDILFFKTGSHGLVSFHGRNYNITKRMTAEQLRGLLSDKTFYPVYSNCYVNVRKITALEQGVAYFGEMAPSAKRLRIPRWKQEAIKRLMGSVEQFAT
ncbi:MULTISPECIES: hypothetical protein [Paenibacillus]|uniref:HTH LytTR-type domain-containing protein n=1 Tax=Paenibacillus campinasensis TaxID=66347 RepID=A0A268ERN7_9BACL|nr:MULTISPECIES: hypothetical protein [Paenibacillus]MUG66272.1 hypothetical protein [Paenibacillus campinasensis]PAD75774.1 hypothetical protein CHH67_14120 [Paenibacillus campinasensis]PAK54525.1 hypothetical protein CHH75_06625 [Paenibacillus sp. 7541]